MTLGDRLAVLRKGALQQVGTPRDLYERPVNLFVAGFIGSPPMNLVPAQVESDALRTPFGVVPFDSGRLPASFDDDHVIVGLRPEQFRDPAALDEEQRRSSATFKAHVDVIEWLGDEQLIYVPFEAPERIARQLTELGRELDVENPRTQLTVQLSADTNVAEGTDIELAVDRRDLHLFDPAQRSTPDARAAAAGRIAGSRGRRRTSHDEPSKRCAEACAQTRARARDGDGARDREHDRLGHLPAPVLACRNGRTGVARRVGAHRRRRDVPRPRVRHARTRLPADGRPVRLRPEGVRRPDGLLDRVELLDRALGRQRRDRDCLRRLPLGLLGRRVHPVDGDDARDRPRLGHDAREPRRRAAGRASPARDRGDQVRARCS